MQAFDLIDFFTAYFVISPSQGKPGAAWRYFSDYLLTKLSTDFVDDEPLNNAGEKFT
ncbi:MAG: hypothetical protein HHJ17_05810 [Rhodoferax sp.]|uniref:hypothetical protein n=1 Tax=Rhodoferax sp. TaxID=50421 RepID=UPI0017D5EFEE|nr:hypothetical protein [Rhodoferax sp.]NMM13046.1 hypothetical protein [Rhodoferax sp.]NMM19324.1 hypothetical protein [Rhodoferax sp.]